MNAQRLLNAICLTATGSLLYLDLHIGEKSNVAPPDEAIAVDELHRERQTTASPTDRIQKMPQDLHSPHPPPTENWLDEDAERRNKANRKAWHRRMHRSAPDVDWKAIERENGLRQIAKRNDLANAPPPPPTEPHEIVPAWVERGSDNQAGRMMVARHGTDPNVLYGGSAKGGVWKGSREGTDWIPIGDNLYGGAHSLEIVSGENEGEPDIVLATTDWGSIHRSVDDGQSWEVPVGLESAWLTKRTLTLTDGSELIFVLVGIDSSHLLMRSQDGGASFESIFDLGAYEGDLWAPRDGGSELYLYDGLAVWRSDDHGDNWFELGSPSQNSSNAEMTGSEAGAPTLWLVLDDSRLWRSDDGGENWFFVHEVSDYWGSLNASATDPDVFAWGGVEVYRTADGGQNFEVVNHWWDYYGDPKNLLHADVPGIDLVINESGEEIWYINTDGGMYRSLDNLQTVENMSLKGLRVSQYYSTHTSSTNPASVIGGTQDQGYQMTAGVQQDGDGVWEFNQVISGDYGHLTSSDGSHDFVFSVYPGFILVQIGEIEPSLDYLDFPANESYVPWLPPIIADPDDKNAFFFPATQIYRYDYVPATGTWAYSLYSQQDFEISSGEYISALRFSPIDSSRAYAATSYGRLWISDDKGLTWTQSQNMVADENWYYGQAVVPSSTDIDTVTIGGSGYGVPAVYRSTNGGVSFIPWSDGLPDTLVYGMAEAPDGSGRLFAGTETSAYMRGPEDEAWTDITEDVAPVTTYWSVEALVAENTIRFGTYGRGIWDYQLDPDYLGCYPIQDWDGDGTDCDLDCNDHRTDISPNADEICGNGVDEDCDGVDLECESTDTGETVLPDPDDNDDTPSDVIGEQDPKTPEKRCGCSSSSRTHPWAIIPFLSLFYLRRKRP